MNNNPIIRLHKASFGYHTQNPVVHDISLRIEKGTITFLIGPNGSGKTTLLKGMMGLLQPMDGDVLIYDKKPRTQRRLFGYVPQHLNFDTSFPITVKEFLQASHPQSYSEIPVLLDEFHMLDYLHQKLGELSGGQLQRVLLVRSLLGDPDILFLDEPVSGIDVGGEENFYNYVKKIQQQRSITVVMVSHEVHLVSSIADHVVCVNKTMLCSGPPEETINPETLKTLYGHDVSHYHHH